MTSILSIIVGFILTGLIGNKLVQGWQARNWFLQQRFIGKEKEYLALKELADEMAVLLGARVYHMQRLAMSLRQVSDEKLAMRIAEYDDIVKRWNERLTSFYVRLPLLASYDLAERLESSIQMELVRIGSDIDNAVRAKQAGNTQGKGNTQKIESALQRLQAKVINFNKQILQSVEAKRLEVYYGEKLDFTKQNLAQFSTWQLVKALFVRDVDALSITRSALDS